MDEVLDIREVDLGYGLCSMVGQWSITTFKFALQNRPFCNGMQKEAVRNAVTTEQTSGGMFSGDGRGVQPNSRGAHE